MKQKKERKKERKKDRQTERKKPFLVSFGVRSELQMMNLSEQIHTCNITHRKMQSFGVFLT